MSSSQRTKKSIKEELPRLMRWDKLSVNKLARQLDISATHISRSCNPAHPETFGGGLAGRTALYFGLPEDYFVEFRREFLLDLIRNGECPTLCVGMTEKERHVYEGQDRQRSDRGSRRGR